MWSKSGKKEMKIQTSILIKTPIINFDLQLGILVRCEMLVLDIFSCLFDHKVSSYVWLPLIRISLVGFVLVPFTEDVDVSTVMSS